MKKFFVRVFRIETVQTGEENVDQLTPMPGTFANDREAWGSITEPGDYILLPVCKYTNDNNKDEHNHGTQE